MNENYSPKEALEHVEHAHQLLERNERALLRFIPLLAAILAIFAGLSSLYSGRLGEEALALKNEALLREVQAADLWTEYQAESIKAHLYETAAESAPQSHARLRAAMQKYRREQNPLRTQAQEQERERDRDLTRSNAAESRKVEFDIALALFEVSIVLTSIAAMIKRPYLFILAGVGGITGLLLGLHGVFSGRQ